ncbi:MAG: alkene reductase [bacterium]
MTDLFSPATVGALSLKNRIAMAPMTRCRATSDHVPTPLMAEFYAARADAGLLITEGTGPDAHGCGYARIPGIWSAEQVEGWRVVTDAVHARGGHIALQLMHTGRVGHPLNMVEGAELLAPSAVKLDGEMWTDQSGPQPYPTPRAMTEAEVEATIEGFVQAAKNAIAAGFDAVELHGANGYLLEQFLCPTTNQRTDAWGGSPEGRRRFVVATAERVAAAIGADRVGIRLSPFGVFNGIAPWDGIAEEYLALVGELPALAYVHLVDHSSMGAPPVPDAFKAALRKAVRGTLVLSGGYDRGRADADLAEGKGDVVAFGRPFIGNPDLVRRLAEGLPLATADHGTFYTPGPKGYTDYPTAD